MNKNFIVLLKIVMLLIFATLLLSCTTTGSGSESLSLMEAIKQSAERIAADLPNGTRIAVTAFESENNNLSDYIIEELSVALVDRGMEVVERFSLEYVYRELDFQMSGDVSDESAQFVGKFLGAQIVITGQMRHLGTTYRFAANAIRVEEATRASATRFEVRDDRALRTMITALNRQPTVARTAGYGADRSMAPQTAGAFLDRGIILASQGEWEMAILDFTETLNLNPNLSAAYLLRGRAASASVSDVISIVENFEGVNVYVQAGRQLSREQTQAYDRAIADFTEAIRLDGNNAVAYSERGEAYLQKGNLDNAIADFNQAIRLNPRYASVYNGRGLAFSYKNDIDRAISDYTQAIRHNPQYSYAYYNRARMYLSRNDYDRAIADLTQAIRLDPNETNAYVRRGYAYERKGDYDRAIADFTQYIRLNPNNAIAFFNRGVAYTNRGIGYIDFTVFLGGGDQARAKEDFDRAIADYTQAIRLEPNFLNAFIARAEMNNTIYNLWGLRTIDGIRRQYLNQAFDDLRKALEIDPNNATVLKYLNSWGT